MPKLKINKKLERLFTAKQQIIVIVGGRGSGKSIGVGDFLTFKMATERADIYCLREFQDSISDSVHRVFIDSIQERLVLPNWDIQANKISAPNGAYTVYKGAARNPDSIQSAQGFKYSWFEEAHKASQSSIDKLLPTILRNKGAKCIFTANPQSSADPFSQRFITPYLKELERDGYYEDKLHLIIVCNWRDNPWWNDEQETLRKWDYENLSRAKYDWIWEGKFNDEVDESIIKAEWFDAAIDAHKTEKLKEAMKPLGAIVAAHDPSDSGKDSKGFALRHGSIIKMVQEKTTGEIDDGCDWATKLALSSEADWFIWDGDGMGAGLKRQVSIALDGTRTQYAMFRGSLAGSGQDNADNIYQAEYGNNASNKTYAETFKNNRAQYYIQLANRFYNTYRAVVKGEYVDPADMISLDSDGIENMANLRSELCRVPRKKNNNGLEQIANKQEMKVMGINSPNMADAVMMSMFSPKIDNKRRPINYRTKVSIA
jgi:phage terminase large subunit